MDDLILKIHNAITSPPCLHDDYHQARAAIRVMADWIFHNSNDDCLMDAEAARRILRRIAEET